MHNPLSVYLVLGTNEGNRVLNLEKALEFINTIPKTCILKKSKPYKSKAYGPVKQPYYLNQAVEVETELSSENLLNQTESIEIKMGRKNKNDLGQRIIDIDIIFYGDETHSSPRLKIPHHDWENRVFFINPLKEIKCDVKRFKKFLKKSSKLL
tara:strand:+ start:8653 stop:9111 length:459 start_codon:yes stop_codon:yes gene_type:complete